MNTPADFRNNGYTGRITGSEEWDDEGTARTTLSILVTCPDGTTYGYFARDADHARQSFFERTR